MHFSSAPNTKNTIGASFPWNVWTVPTLVGLLFLSYLVKPILFNSCDNWYATFLNGLITYTISSLCLFTMSGFFIIILWSFFLKNSPCSATYLSTARPFISYHSAIPSDFSPCTILPKYEILFEISNIGYLHLLCTHNGIPIQSSLLVSL